MESIIAPDTATASSSYPVGRCSEDVRELGESRTKIGPIGVDLRRDHGGDPRGSVRVARCPDTVNLEEHDGREDMKVWLADQEVEQLLEVASDVDVEDFLAIGLGVRCGLRSAEVLDVEPRDVQDTTAGKMLRVQDGKGGKYRETPISTELATTISTIADVRDASKTEPLLDVTTRILRRWVATRGLELADRTGDDGWHHLPFHDLRRTWATLMKFSGVDAMVVCDWGGWDDLETFQEHYRGTSTPDAQHRERKKISWL